MEALGGGIPGICQSNPEADIFGATAGLLERHALVYAAGGDGASRQRRRELVEIRIFWRGRCALVRRYATSLHRRIVPNDAEAWSLFIIGPKVRAWGFQPPPPGGGLHNVDYTTAPGGNA